MILGLLKKQKLLCLKGFLAHEKLEKTCNDNSLARQIYVLLLNLKTRYDCDDIKSEDEIQKIFYHDFINDFENIDPQLEKHIENVCIQILKAHVADWQSL